MLMLGLMALSWLKNNLKKKTENGHCHNSIQRAQKLINQRAVQSEVVITGTCTAIIHQYWKIL